MSESSKLLPQFPLKLVVFPGEKLNLHIFESRYKQLISDCEKHKILFGIPTILSNGKLTEGTFVKLLEIKNTYSDGKMDISCMGLSPYTIKEYYEKLDDKLYAGANVEKIEISTENDYLANQKIIKSVLKLYSYMNINKTIDEDPNTFDVFQCAHKIGLTLNQELQLLRLPAAPARQEFVLDHLDKLLPTVQKMEKLRKKIQMNGHFKNIKTDPEI